MNRMITDDYDALFECTRCIATRFGFFYQVGTDEAVCHVCGDDMEPANTCPECLKAVRAESLVKHMQEVHPDV